MKRIIRYIRKLKKEIEELEKEWERTPHHSELKWSGVVYYFIMFIILL